MADPNRYRVSNSGRANEQLAALANLAMSFGVRERLAQCLRRIQDELRVRPLEWGEPKSRLRGAELILCVGFDDRIRVNFGVHERHPVVFVQNFEAQLGHPLYVPPDA